MVLVSNGEELTPQRFETPVTAPLQIRLLRKRKASALGYLLLPDRGSPRRAARFGLGIQFEDREDDQEIGRLVESTVWVNRAHPAYQRAVATRSVGYHIALAVGLALASLAVEPAKEHEFLTACLSCWGDGGMPKKRGSRKWKVSP